MSWWCNQGGGGTAGIAYVGTLCMGDGYNTNLNEGDSSKAVSGYVSLPVFTHMYDVIILSMIQAYYGTIDYVKIVKFSDPITRARSQLWYAS